MNNIRDIRTKVGAQAVDEVVTAVNQIEEEMMEAAVDAVAALQAYDIDGEEMVPYGEGDYVKRDEAMDAIRALRR